MEKDNSNNSINIESPIKITNDTKLKHSIKTLTVTKEQYEKFKENINMKVLKENNK